MPADASAAWTNVSVLGLVGGADPLQAAADLANDIITAARAEGLDGPPFDPFSLAELLGLSLRARADIADARIRTDTTGVRTSPRTPLSRFIQSPHQLVIEYNPTRPRGRLRYNVAHEIAHGLFPDVADVVRHRTGTGALPHYAIDDAWQLELLCNVIAAELLMPEPAVKGLVDIDLDIDFVMEHRRRFDVSTEALLRRLPAISKRAIALIAASRAQDSPGSELMVEYIIPSSQFTAQVRRSAVLAADGVLGRCIAVGQTARGTENVDGTPMRVQAVGTPPYPGNAMPRVLALVEPDASPPPDTAFEHVVGDVTEIPAGASPVVLAHVVTDAARAWSRRGVAGALTRRFPSAAKAFHSWSVADERHLALGNAHIIEAERSPRRVHIASLVAQRGYGAGTATRLDYGALREGLTAVAEFAVRERAVVHLPRIGAGQAGGRWDFIAEAIAETLGTAGVHVVVHTMPSAPRGVTT
jgi:O-acetyl-ADP-ribose deacetylase (regulator of RNase III)